MARQKSAYQPFGEIIRQARKKRGWLVQELATKVGIQKGYVSGIESGRVKPPKIWLVVALAKLLKLNANELLMRAHVERAPSIIRDKLKRLCFPTKSQSPRPRRSRGSWMML